MNRRGFTLVEVLIAGALFMAGLACFGCLLKVAKDYVVKLENSSRRLYESRSEMEKLRRLPFDQLLLAGGTKIVILSSDLCLIQTGKLYTLRSKYQ